MVTVLRLAGVLVLLKFFDIFSLKLTMLVVTVRLVKRDRYNVEDIRRPLEDVIHLLERTVSCLGVKEPHSREDAGVTGSC